MDDETSPTVIAAEAAAHVADIDHREARFQQAEVDRWRQIKATLFAGVCLVIVCVFGLVVALVGALRAAQTSDSRLQCYRNISAVYDTGSASMLIGISDVVNALAAQQPIDEPLKSMQTSRNTLATVTNLRAQSEAACEDGDLDPVSIIPQTTPPPPPTVPTTAAATVTTSP